MTASDPQLPEPDLSGLTLDRYQLLRRIGVGGMGAVYEAEHTRLRKRFAVKLLRYDLARDETFRKRFLREARAASAITHPNVVAISDFGETADDQVFFVMEMLAGHDLQELLDAAGRLPWPRTRDILLQVTSALQAAHAQEIIHRDIKPSNVFLADVVGKESEDYVKVLDFGIAKLSGQMGEATVKLTSTDEIFGTVAYMAPEMAMGVNDDRRSDVYAVGVMMYRMLTGALPFTQGNAFQILSQHINAAVPLPREKEPSIAVEVEQILLRALAKSPDDRFASMDDFGRALRRGSLEATEVLVGLHTAALVGTPTRYEGTPAATIDKTTPLPSSGLTRGREAIAVPLEVSPTVVSSPIALASAESAPIAWPQPPAYPSGPIVAPAPAPIDQPRSSLPRFLLLAGAVAVVATAITLFAIRDPEPTESAPSPPKTAATTVDPNAAEPGPVPIAPTKVEPAPTVNDPAAAPKPEPELAKDEPIVEPEPDEPELAKDEPIVEPVEPKPKPKQKQKPKTDAEVIAGLKAKLVAQCKASGTTKVRVEGMITGAGTTTGLLITPPTGPGACANGLVSKTRFDAAPGSRPIPRFSVEL